MLKILTRSPGSGQQSLSRGRINMRLLRFVRAFSHETAKVGSGWDSRAEKGNCDSIGAVALCFVEPSIRLESPFLWHGSGWCEMPSGRLQSANVQQMLLSNAIG
jgi:hypothetical protein